MTGLIGTRLNPSAHEVIILLNMSRHKNLKGMIADSYLDDYGEQDEEDEYSKMHKEEDDYDDDGNLLPKA